MVTSRLLSLQSSCTAQPDVTPVFSRAAAPIEAVAAATNVLHVQGFIEFKVFKLDNAPPLLA